MSCESFLEHARILHRHIEVKGVVSAGCLDSQCCLQYADDKELALSCPGPTEEDH